MDSAKKDKNTKLFRHLKKWMEKAILDFQMIEEGDRLLIGVSGGADSFALLDLLDSPMIFTPKFSFLAVNIDMGFDISYSGYDTLEKYLQENNYRYVMEKTDIGLGFDDRLHHQFAIVAHHRDDIIETLLINMFYGREISTMVPNQKIFGGKLHIIRPLAYLGEELIKKYSRERQFPTVENDCPTSRKSRRMYVKNLLNELAKENKDIRDNIFKAMSHVKPDYLLPLSKKR